MLLRTIGGMDNKEAFTELAHRVPYAAILRERQVPQNVEAMLIGASGLLEIYPHDIYILDLKRNFEYLATKYSITPMRASEWKLTKILPNNHPILRLSQVATFLRTHATLWTAYYSAQRQMMCTDSLVARLFLTGLRTILPPQHRVP
jgi:hypothetical protein